MPRCVCGAVGVQICWWRSSQWLAAFNDEPKLSRFLVPIGLPKLGHFVGQPDEIDDEKRAVMWKVLRRAAAQPEDIATAVAE
jgi:hypothetical protein